MIETAESHVIRPLTRSQHQYAREIVQGKRKASPRLDKLPQVQQAIKDLQVHANALVSYDMSRAMRSCEKAVDFAYEKGNPMAVVKGTELICKLAGLLIEKHEVLTISLKDALDLAKQRALEREKPNSSVTILPRAETETGGAPGGGGAEQSQQPQVSGPSPHTG